MTAGRSGALFVATRIGLVLVFLLLGLQARRCLIEDDLPLHADEAGHALPAARMALAIGEADLRGFAAASLRELVWPFLHPLVIASGFLLFGLSAEVARTSSLVAFGAAVFLLPGFARALSAPETPARGPAFPMLGWLSAAILVAAAPWDLVSSVMGEPLGMLAGVATLWAAARASDRRSPAAHAPCGLLAAAAFFVKYGYGVPLIAALLLSLALRARALGFGPLLGAAVGALAPIAAWAGAVFAREPSRLGEWLGVLVNKDEGVRGLANALFYGQVLFDSVGWPVAVAVLLLLLATLPRRPEAARLAPLLFVGLALLLLTLHPNKQQRYLFPVLPVMLVLAEVEAARLLLPRRKALGVLWPALAALALVALDPLRRLEESAASATELRGSRAIVDYLADNVPPGRPALLLGSTGLLPHYALTWELIERQRREPEIDLLPFPGDSGWDPRFRSGYPAQMRPEYGELLREALAGGRYQTVVTLALREDSPFRPAWLAKWDAWGQNYVHAADELHREGALALRAERSFPQDRAQVRVFAPGPP